MNDILLLSDPHLGFSRTSGVTPESLKAFREYQFNTFQNLLSEYPENPKIILGDLFNTCMVDNITWLRTLEILTESTGKMLIMAGNHDLSRRADQLPSFNLLGEVLCAIREDPVEFAIAPMTWRNFHVVPHVASQEIFDTALANVPDKATVLLHSCCNNPFAAEKDHSLNFTFEQVTRFGQVISGHEHNHKKTGNTHMIGSLLPCSIDEAGTDKYAWLLNPQGLLRPIRTYSADNAYAEVNWRDLDALNGAGEVQFIRVIGDAEPEQGALVIQEINKLRRHSAAFFITNSVTVGGIELQALEDAVGSVDTFDAEAVFWKVLDPKFTRRIQTVLQGAPA